MSHQRALLEAILRAPEDTNARLVYADYLLERGDPRGTFIALECALAAKITSVERKKLREQADVLLRAHITTWTALLEKCGASGKFQRGFIRELNADAERFLGDGAPIFDVEPIEQVELTDISAEVMRALVEVPIWSHVSRIGLRGTLGDEGIAAIAQADIFPRLVSLNISRVGLGETGAHVLVGAPWFAQLEMLTISGNPLGDRGMSAIAAAPASRLKSLYAAEARLTDHSAFAIANSSSLAGLVNLGLSRNEIDEFGARALRESPHLTRLRSLEL